MTYFVTGATGFIGRHLVEQLLKRDGDIHVLVRPASAQRLDELMDGWGQRSRVHPVIGDLGRPRLGLSDDQVGELRGTVAHFFHLAAIYDMTADDERNSALNVGGTRNAVDQVLHMAYKVFPDSAAAKADGGDPDAADQKPSGEAIALAHLMKGVHW